MPALTKSIIFPRWSWFQLLSSWLINYSITRICLQLSRQPVLRTTVDPNFIRPSPFSRYTSLNSYPYRLDPVIPNILSACNKTPPDTNHLFAFPLKPILLTPLSLYFEYVETARFLDFHLDSLVDLDWSCLLISYVTLTTITTTTTHLTWSGSLNHC